MKNYNDGGVGRQKNARINFYEHCFIYYKVLFFPGHLGNFCFPIIPYPPLPTQKSDALS